MREHARLTEVERSCSLIMRAVRVIVLIRALLRGSGERRSAGCVRRGLSARQDASVGVRSVEARAGRSGLLLRRVASVTAA